jgi:hypothetical protein
MEFQFCLMKVGTLIIIIELTIMLNLSAFDGGSSFF